MAWLSGVQSAAPSELSLNGKCLGWRMRVPPSVRSAKYVVCFPAHFRKASLLPSAVSLMPLIQNPDQFVSRFGSRAGFPLRRSSRISQKLQEPPREDSGSSREKRSRPSASHKRSLSCLISLGPNIVTGGPLFRSRLRRVSPDWSVTP